MTDAGHAANGHWGGAGNEPCELGTSSASPAVYVAAHAVSYA